MFSIDFIAWLCVIGFCGEDVYYIPAVHEKCMEILYNHECLDARELQAYKDYLKMNSSYVYYMNYSVATYRYNFLKNCPHLYAVNRFPPAKIIEQNLKRNIEREEYFTAQLETCRSYERDALEQARANNALLYEFWASIMGAKDESYYITVRREYMQKCINIIGIEQFLFGNFPPYFVN